MHRSGSTLKNFRQHSKKIVNISFYGNAGDTVQGRGRVVDRRPDIAFDEKCRHA